MQIRRAARRYLPFWLRLRFALIRRALRDRGVTFATTRAPAVGFPHLVCRYERPFIDYPGQEAVSVAKRANQRILASHLSGVVIATGEVFSVWELAPRPTTREGYREAAALKSGVLTTDVGGAICLLSTVLYNVGLLGAMRIVERHCHSRDNYGEARYFELGRDAAIEFGYRDLRFQNPHPFPVKLAIEVAERAVVAELFAPQPAGFEVQLSVGPPEILELPKLVLENPEVSPGTEAILAPALPGLRVHTLRRVHFDDGRRQQDDLGWSVHEPIAAIVHRGTG